MVPTHPYSGLSNPIDPTTTATDDPSSKPSDTQILQQFLSENSLPRLADGTTSSGPDGGYGGYDGGFTMIGRIAENETVVSGTSGTGSGDALLKNDVVGGTGVQQRKSPVRMSP